VSPIYIRPAREQAEHDRLTLFLEAKHGKKLDVLINKGDARDYALKIGTGTYFPDLILQESGKPVGVIEIETGESTNNLEALAQWVHFGKAKVPFHLYVPVVMFDAARRFCEQNHVTVSEIWTYRPLMDGFDLVRVFQDPQAVSKSGKGSVAKVVEMPKPVEQPKPEPAPEPVEEILARISSREAARAAAKAAAKPAKFVVVKTAAIPPAPKPAKPVAPAKAEPKVVPPPAKPVAKVPEKAKPVAKPAAKAVAKKAVKPVAKPAPKPVAKAKAVKKPGKPSKPAKPVKKVAPKAKPQPKPKARPKPSAKPAAKKKKR
jgi:hypothetical protein